MPSNDKSSEEKKRRATPKTIAEQEKIKENVNENNGFVAALKLLTQELAKTNSHKCCQVNKRKNKTKSNDLQQESDSDSGVSWSKYYIFFFLFLWLLCFFLFEFCT